MVRVAKSEVKENVRCTANPRAPGTQKRLLYFEMVTSVGRREKFCILKRLVMVAVLVPLSLSVGAEFKGIQVGQDAACLPQTLRERGNPALREGYHQGSWLRVVLLNEKVLLVDVVYSGEISPNVFINHRITLAQAVNLHSLRGQAAPPEFGYAVNPAGKTIGLVDLQGAIVYRTLPVAGENKMVPDRLVFSVGYVEASTPVVKTATVRPLEIDTASQLMIAARAAVVPRALRW